MVVASQAQVDGLFNIGGRSRKGVDYVSEVDEILVKNVKDAMYKLGVRFALKLSEFMPVSSGAMSNPDNFYVEEARETKNGYSVTIKVGTEYTDYIDKGVQGVKNIRKTYKNADGRYYRFKNYGMPLEALKSLQGWVKRKNIELEATALIRNQKVPSEIDATTKTLAYFIKKNGIEGRNFKQRSLDAVMKNFNLDIQSIGADSLTLKFNVK